MASEDMNKEESKQQSVSTQKKMDHQEHTSQHNSQQDKRLLKSFWPDDLAQKETACDKFKTFLLRLKAVIPLLVSLFLIYLITFVYLFTFCVPLVWETYNDNTDFFFDNPSSLPGIRKMPKVYHYLLFISTIVMFLIINFSFFRAAFTPAGSLPNEYEWDVKEETLCLFKSKNQGPNGILDIDVDRVSSWF